MRRSPARSACVTLVVGSLALVTVACGGQKSASSTPAAASGPSPTARLKIISVSTNPTSNPIGAIVANGQKLAAKELGVDVEYRSTSASTTSPNEVKRLLENAIASKPDGIIMTDTVPLALNPTITAAAKAGIPIVLASTGFGEAASTGALTYVGNDETQAGMLGGKRLGQLGAKHAMLITIPPGVPLADQRNEGFQKGFPGKVTKLAVKDFNDATAMRNAIEASLQKDPSIDAVFNAGVIFTPPELAAQARLGDRASKIKWAALDIDAQTLRAVKARKLEFALDQQPFLQGYLPVLFLAQYKRYAIKPAIADVPTGPSVIDATNVDQVLDLADQKLR
jgi:simple sugar transport system substrate-binding protein